MIKSGCQLITLNRLKKVDLKNNISPSASRFLNYLSSMKNYFLFFSFFMLSTSGSAQRTEQYYDYQWRPIAVDKALFFSITDNYGDLFHRRDYYIRDDKLLMDGYFTDRKCKVKQGYFYYYYPSGNLQIASSYENNDLHGWYLGFYDDGMMKDSSLYLKGNIIGNAFSWHRNGMMKDSTMMNKDGSGSSVSWHANGMPSAGGYFAAGGKMRGTWQFFHYNGKPSAREQYDNGKLQDKKYFDENGNEEKDTASTDREAGFPGGGTAWIKYLSNQAYLPPGWEAVKPGEIVVVVSAVIDEEGKVTGAYVSSPFHPAFDQIALKMMVASPRWIPAIAHHRKIKTEVRLPVTFGKAE